MQLETDNRQVAILPPNSVDVESPEVVPAGTSSSCATKLRYAIFASACLCLLTYVYISTPETRWWILQNGSVPMVAAIVGWGTNAVAIFMTFYPLEFRGCCPRAQICGMPLCGWQGIIPANCGRMAEQAVDLMTTRLLDVSSTFSRLDPERVTFELRPPLEALVPKILDTVAKEYAPGTWNRMPGAVKNELVRKCMEDTSSALTSMMKETHQDVTQAFDLREVLVDLLTKDKQLVNDIFLKCAAQEFIFIRVSGFYLGFLFGIPQLGIWSLWPLWWVLPVAGFVVGYLTNWVALKLIFRPIDPYRCCGFTIQGLFLTRQQEVATVYAQLLSSRVLNAENLLLGMLAGKCSDSLFEALDKSINQGIDNIVPSRRITNMVIGQNEYGLMKVRVCELIRADIKTFLPHLTPYVDEALDVQTTLELSMRGLSTQEFADMLLPVFQEGEMKLVVIGGILGVIVGMFQALLQVPEQFGL